MIKKSVVFAFFLLCLTSCDHETEDFHFGPRPDDPAEEMFSSRVKFDDSLLLIVV